MSEKKSVLTLVAVLIVLLAIFAVIWLCFMPHGSKLDKTITFEVSHLDGTANSFTLMSNCETLGELLEANELIAGEDGPYGLYVKTVDGETVDESLNQWWCFTKDGEMLMTGVDDTVIADGEHYEAAILTY